MILSIVFLSNCTSNESSKSEEAIYSEIMKELEENGILTSCGSVNTGCDGNCPSGQDYKPFQYNHCYCVRANNSVNIISSDEEKWSLEEVIENTRNDLTELGLAGDLQKEELDLSYITQELIDDYWNNAKEKEVTTEDLAALQNVACYWGNNWVHLSANKWAYTNNYSGTGCDPVSTSTLCGSGQRWKATVNKISGRYCANGAKNPNMAWP